MSLASASMRMLATNQMNARASSSWMKTSTKSQLCWTSGTSLQRLTSKCRALKARHTCSDTMRTRMNGRSRADSMAMSCWAVRTSSWSQLTRLLYKAEQRIDSCEHCHPQDAEIPFDWILAEVTGKRGAFEFILSEPARCPNCKQLITEKTLIEPRD